MVSQVQITSHIRDQIEEVEEEAANVEAEAHIEVVVEVVSMRITKEMINNINKIITNRKKVAQEEVEVDIVEDIKERAIIVATLKEVAMVAEVAEEDTKEATKGATKVAMTTE